MTSSLLSMPWTSKLQKKASPVEVTAKVRESTAPTRAISEESFEALMERHGKLVYGTARKLLRHAEDAQDASQEVFLRLYRSLGRLDPARPIEPWLYRVTVNVCRDLHKHRPQEPFLEPREEARLVSHDDPAADSAAREESRILNQGLATLGEKERAALVLRDIRGLDTAEVAAILGSTPQTVRSQISRARWKLDAYRQRRHRGDRS